MKKRTIAIIAAAVIIIAAMSAVYVSGYSNAGDEAAGAMRSGGGVTVTETGYGWLFDGPSEEDAYIFYPGAMVQAEAYAPLLHKLAENGMDVCLVRMPLRNASFGMGKAEAIMDEYDYKRWYIGGHSHGGAMAAYWAAKHGEELSGVILLAAYPIKQLDGGLTEILIYGSEDKVVNTGKIIEGRQYAPSDFTEYVIQGGNHAQFGDYGKQKGDGEASVDSEDQLEETVRVILEHTAG